MQNHLFLSAIILSSSSFGILCAPPRPTEQYDVTVEPTKQSGGFFNFHWWNHPVTKPTEAILPSPTDDRLFQSSIAPQATENLPTIPSVKTIEEDSKTTAGSVVITIAPSYENRHSEPSRSTNEAGDVTSAFGIPRSPRPTGDFDEAHSTGSDQDVTVESGVELTEGSKPTEDGLDVTVEIGHSRPPRPTDGGEDVTIEKIVGFSRGPRPTKDTHYVTPESELEYSRGPRPTGNTQDVTAESDIKYSLPPHPTGDVQYITAKFGHSQPPQSTDELQDVTTESKIGFTRGPRPTEDVISPSGESLISTDDLSPSGPSAIELQFESSPTPDVAPTLPPQ